MERLQSNEGVIWREYGVKVKGYSLDAEVKHFRVLGVSPETSAADIKQTFAEAEIGEVLDIKKGLLDERRMPGVSNGTWSLRVKILDPEKYIPSYIHRRDEGEIWSLNFEGRVFCCWKCGSGDHIGDKCRDQSKTFEEVFNSSNPDFIKPTWATVVRSGKGVSDQQEERTREMELRLKELNKRRQAAKLDPGTVELTHLDKESPPQTALQPQVRVDGSPEDSVTDSQMLKAVPEGSQCSVGQVVGAEKNPTEVPCLAAPEGIAERGVIEGNKNDPDISEMSLVFGPGASAISKGLSSNVSNTESSPSDASPGKVGNSTPLRKRSRGRRRIRNSGRSSLSSPSPIRPPSQKVRLDGDDVSGQDDQTVTDQGQQNDLLDPGDHLADQNASIVKELQQLCDSGDWGDTSVEGEGIKVGGNVDIPAKDSENIPKDGVEADISSVVTDQDALNLATSSVEPIPEAPKGL